LQFLRTCDTNGTVGAQELKDLIIAEDNQSVLDVLRNYYGLQQEGGPSPLKIYRASSYIRMGTQHGL
jgi:hypothetical protein